MKNPLLDNNFLKQLYLYKHKEVFAKIILLSFDELPVKEITGKITAGSVNVDGNSAVRRTCSLTMVTPESYINDAHWGLRNKFKLEVGLKNFINDEYPEIIWFKQGVFVITSLNESFATNSHQITIQGKDKMCLLNGEVGGNLIASTDFGKLEEYKKDKQGNEYLEYIYLKIKDIIKYAVSNFGMELPHNIIINEVEDSGKELLEYRGDKPLYLYKESQSNEITQMFFEAETGEDDYAGQILKAAEFIDDEEKGYYISNANESKIRDLLVKRDFKVDESETDYQQLINDLEEKIQTSMSEDERIEIWKRRALYTYLRQHKIAKMESDNYDKDGNFIFEAAIPELTAKRQAATIISFSDSGVYDYILERPEEDYILARPEEEKVSYCTVIKIENGQTAGYRQTDLTYPGDLIANIGESLTSVLDKIKQMFGDYEYFYDLDGRFVFQQKKTYINNSWNNLIVDEENNDTYANSAAYTSAVTWTFEDNLLLTAFSNNPNIQNLKNDYGVWGERTSVSGEKLPVHIRYAIQNKPVYYYSITKDNAFITKDYDDERIGAIVDWRELIYQMSLDYFQYYNNPETDLQNLLLNHGDNKKYYPFGITGYEMFYTDMQGFWRQLYNPEALTSMEKEEGVLNIEKIKKYPMQQIDGNRHYKNFWDNNVDYAQLILEAAEFGDSEEEGYYISNANEPEIIDLLVKRDFKVNESDTDYQQLVDDLEEKIQTSMTMNERIEVWKQRALYRLLRDHKTTKMNSDNYDEYGNFIFKTVDENGAQSNSGTIVGLNQGLLKFYASAPNLEVNEDNIAKYYCYTYEDESTSPGLNSKQWVELKVPNEVGTRIYNVETGWEQNVTEHPENLNFWFDFISADSELGKYSISTIGDRTKVVNDNKVSGIYFKETPTILFTFGGNFQELKNKNPGYTVMKVPSSYAQYFSISAQGKSAQNALTALLNQHAFTIDSTTLTSVPIYHLQPNTRIFIKDDNTKVNGEYIISKFSIPLAYNGTTSITASKAVENIY